MNKIRFLLLAILLEGNCSQLAKADVKKEIEPREQVESAQTLKQLANTLKKEGWEEVSSAPSVRDPEEGVVVENEFLESVQLNQKVSLKFPWVVIGTVKVPPNTERKVRTGFKFVDQNRRTFKIIDASGSTHEMDIIKQKAEPSSKHHGLSIEETIKTLGNEEILVVGLQQAVRVYNSKGNLLGEGYKMSFSCAAFKKLNKK